MVSWPRPKFAAEGCRSIFGKTIGTDVPDVSDGTYWVEAGVTPDDRIAVEEEIFLQALNATATTMDNAIDLMFMAFPPLESSVRICGSSDYIKP
jgi:hypothetical protein